MLKLIVGVKGTGKTKTLIEMVNKAAAESKGSVICIERGSKLNYDVTHKARLVDCGSYKIEDAEALYGFIAGILASNSDITDIFVDSALKICGDDVAGFAAILAKLDNITKDVNLVMTASIAVDECPDAIKAYA